MSDLTNIYSRVTSRLIEHMEQGVRPWIQPWTGRKGANLPLRHHGLPYRGIDILILWDQVLRHGYDNRHWMTLRQANELGGRIRKGEHQTYIVYTSKTTKKDENEDGNEVRRERAFLKTYGVFNVDQIDGLPEQYNITLQPVLYAQPFFESTGADIRYGFDKAAYSPARDVIMMPHPEAFISPESCCATLCHELAHWTKHPPRLNRDFGAKAFGDEGYAREELVAHLN